MVEISKYDLEIALNQLELSTLDIYKNLTSELIVEIEQFDQNERLDIDLVIAELQLSFSEITTVIYDDILERFVIVVCSDFELIE